MSIPLKTGEVNLRVAVLGAPSPALLRACRHADGAGGHGSGVQVTVVPLGGNRGEEELRDADLCILCAPPRHAGAAVRGILKARKPLLVTVGACTDEVELERFAQAVRKRKLASAVVGTLRLAPAVARIREMVASGVLGTVTRVSLRRTASTPSSDRAAEPVELFRDVDVVGWLLDGGGAADHLRVARDDNGIVVAGGEAEPTAGSLPAPGARRLELHATLGSVGVDFSMSATASGGGAASALLILARDGVSRQIRVPAGDVPAAELTVAFGALRFGEFWDCLPPLTECLSTWGIVRSVHPES